MEHLARGQIGGAFQHGGRKIGALCQRAFHQGKWADSLDYFARGQIDGGISPGGR